MPVRFFQVLSDKPERHERKINSQQHAEEPQRGWRPQADTLEESQGLPQAIRCQPFADTIPKESNGDRCATGEDSDSTPRPCAIGGALVRRYQPINPTFLAVRVRRYVSDTLVLPTTLPRLTDLPSQRQQQDDDQRRANGRGAGARGRTQFGIKLPDGRVEVGAFVGRVTFCVCHLGLQWPSFGATDFEEAWGLVRHVGRIPYGEARGDKGGALIRVTEWWNAGLQIVTQLKAKARCDNQVARIADLSLRQQKRIEIGREEHCLGKFRSQRLQDRQLVIDVAA